MQNLNLRIMNHEGTKKRRTEVWTELTGLSEFGVDRVATKTGVKSHKPGAGRKEAGK